MDKIDPNPFKDQMHKLIGKNVDLEVKLNEERVLVTKLKVGLKNKHDLVLFFWKCSNFKASNYFERGK